MTARPGPAARAAARASAALLLGLGALASCARLGDLAPTGVREAPSRLRLVWAKDLDPPSRTGNLPIALNAPLVHGGVLYIGDNAGLMRAFRLSDGRELWSERDGEGYHAGPAVSGDALVYGDAAGRVRARHRGTGALKYAVDLGASVESEPLVHRGRFFVHTRNHQIVALDVETGKILWSYRRSVPLLTTLQGASRPVVHGTRLFAGFADGTLAALSVEDGSLLWERKIARGEKFVDVDMAPVVFGDRLYAGLSEGDLHVFDPGSGRLLATIPDRVARSPEPLGDRLAYTTASGDLVLLDRRGEEAGRAVVSKDEALGHVAAWGDAIVVSSVRGRLFLLDGETLRVLEDRSLGHEYSAVFGRLGVEGGRLAVFSSRNRLYVFQGG